MMFEEGEYYSPSEFMFSCINTNLKTKKKMMNKKRFSDDQVKSLELIFENETKLEPKKKVQLARELGLHPRQVAIWFQNKRARYKSKQLEHDYSILRANYNVLASQFDSLKKEKHDLFLQVQKLRNVTSGKCDKQEDEETNSNSNKKSHEKCTEIITKLSNDDHDDHDHNRDDDEPNQELSMEGAGSEYGASSILSDEGSSEIDNLNKKYNKMVDPTLTVDQSNSNWDDHLRPDLGFFDDDHLPVDHSAWWDFWS